MIHGPRCSPSAPTIRPEKVVKAVLEAEVTRIPLWKGKPENIVGILRQGLLRAIQTADGDLAKIDATAIARVAVVRAHIRPLSEQLKAFRRRKAFARWWSTNTGR